MRLLALALALLPAVVGSAFARHAGDPPEPQPPNVLLIVLDDVGFEKLGWWPHQLPQQGTTGIPPTPTLQWLASQGVAFTNFWTNPSCSASRAQILTGRSSHRTGMGEPMRPWSPSPLGNAEFLLPELVRVGNSAYRTGAFGKWHVVKGGEECHPTQNGFEIFQGHMFNVTELDATPQGTCLRGHHFWWDKVTSPGTSQCADTTRIGQEGGPYPPASWEAWWSSSVTRTDALTWIDGIPSTEPFFAYVAFNSPHEPLQVPPFPLLSAATVAEIQGHPHPLGPFEAGFRLPCLADPSGPWNDCSEGCLDFLASDCGTPDAAFDLQRLRVQILNWMIESVDTEIALLLAGLGSRLDDTLIFVVSDNGTAQRQVDCPLNPRHAKLWPYQLGARVPLVVWGPRVIPEEKRGTIAQALVGSVDLWRTIAEATGMCPAEIDVAFDRAHQAQPPAPQETWTLDSTSFFHRIADPALLAGCVQPEEPPSRSTVLYEWFTGFKPHWDTLPANFRRGVTHASGLKLTHLLGPPPPGNDIQDLLHLPSDPGEILNLVQFLAEGLQPARAPCPPFAACAPHPPCPNPPCHAGSPCSAACAPMTPPCDSQILEAIVRDVYLPLYCTVSTSN